MNYWNFTLLLAFLVLILGCGEKKTKQKNKEVYREPITLKPYSEPLPDSVLNRKFSYGADSPKQLAMALVNVLNKKDSLGLWNYAVNEKEYLNWIWPEEPSSDPKFNIPLEFAWENLYRDSYKGLKKLHKKYGGKELELVSMKLLGEKIKHQTYMYHREPELKIKYPDGSTDVISEIGTIVELNGRYKVLFYSKD